MATYVVYNNACIDFNSPKLVSMSTMRLPSLVVLLQKQQSPIWLPMLFTTMPVSTSTPLNSYPCLLCAYRVWWFSYKNNNLQYGYLCCLQQCLYRLQLP